MSMTLNAIIEQQLECVSGPQELGFQKVADDEQQEWAVCLRTISQQKWVVAATATEQQKYDQEKGTSLYEPINFLNFQSELTELADLMLDEWVREERMKVFLSKVKTNKWEHFNYHADRDLTTLSKIIGVEELANQADQFLHWRDRKRIKEKWGF